MKQMTIKKKITLWYTGIIAVVLGTILVLVLLFVDKVGISATEEEIIAAVTGFSSNINFQDDSFYLDGDTEFYDNGIMFCIYDKNGRLLYGTIPAQFPEETIINGLDCSELTIDDATQLLKLKQNEEFIIILKNNDIVSLKAHDFDYCLNDIEPKLEEMKDKAWNSKAQKREYQVVYSYNETMLENKIDSLEQMSEEYMKDKSKSSCSYSQEEKKFIASNKDSYYLDKKDVIDAIKNAIAAGENTATIGDELYKVEDPKDYLEDNNRISTYVEYLLPNGKKYKLDADILHLWLPLDDEGEPYFDDEIWKQNVEEFVSNELKSLVDTTGKVRSFKPTDEKKSVDVNPGNYGYRIDVKAELLQLTQDLSSGKNVIRKPVYENEEVSSENDGIGNSYVEIDLTRQHVWVYIDGELKIETDCVTGDVNKKYETPTGVYYLNYKRKGKTLVGEKDKNGTAAMTCC